MLVTLQDLANQVGSFVESCRSAPELVFAALFPLNPVPQGLADLMKRFRQGEAIEGFVRGQLEAGARFALALVHIHLPCINLKDLSRGPPSDFDVESTLLGPFYMAAEGPAKSIVALLEHETAVSLRRQRAEL